MLSELVSVRREVLISLPAWLLPRQFNNLLPLFPLCIILITLVIIFDTLASPATESAVLFSLFFHYRDPKVITLDA